MRFISQMAFSACAIVGLRYANPTYGCIDKQDGYPQTARVAAVAELNLKEKAMTTITLDDKVIKEVIAVGHYRNAQEAVANILTDYVRRHKKEPSLFEQLRLNEEAADDRLAVLFERNKDTGRNVEL